MLTLPLLTTAVWLMAAGPTVACSCAMPGPLAEYDLPQSAIFSGVAGPLDARGVPVRVTTWFHGTGAAPLVYLNKASFGDGASCGTTPPAVGASFIWVAWYPEEGGDPATGLCNPSAQLGTPEGNAMLADAEATFGGAPPPGANLDPPEMTSPVPADMAPVILAGTVGLGVVVIGLVFLLGRRRQRKPG